MFEQFSSGYYLGRLYVQLHDGPRAVLRESHHRQVCEQLYGSTATSESEDPPLVMRYQRQHFVVDGDDGIPEQTLAVPEEWLADRPDPLEPREVFLAKADRAHQLLQFAAGRERADSEDGPDGSGERESSANPFTPRALGEVARPGRRQ
jgi:hypothetical protein